jgi:hypothetical protein
MIFAPKSPRILVHLAAGPTVERSSTVTPPRAGVPAGDRSPLSVEGDTQKFFGRPSLRLAMMFFWISDAPPPIVSMTV